MKKSVATILRVIFLILCSSQVYAFNTYYVRTDGGDATQCNGLTDVAYPGSGAAQACAFNHPFWALPPGRSPLIQGGDTLIIGAGEYKMGLGAPNTVGKASVCYSAWAYDCTAPAIPSGPDPAHPTRVFGKGWDTKESPPPQLYGVERPWQILNLSASNNVEIRYLELTDHSSCIYNSPDPAKRCNRSTYPFGDHGDYGIAAKDSSNVFLKDLNIHSMSVGGIKAGRITDWTLEGVILRGNGFVGWNGDVGGTSSSNSGKIIFRDSRIEYSGCGEQYPSGQIYGCFSQDQGGYGDGLGTQATGGDWLFENSEMSHNVSDGLDLLYHNGNGTITINNSRFEGNAGNAVKVATDTTIENSILISNCEYFSNNPIAEQGGNSTYSNQAAFNNCRAGGTTLAAAGWKPGRSLVMMNSLVAGTSQILIEVGGSTCDGSEKFISRNNIFLGMESWYKKNHGEPGVKANLFYLDGIDGNGSGPCGPSNPATSIKFDNKDSIAFNTKTNYCPNSNNVLCVDPQLTSIPPLANTNDIYTYGDRWNVMPQLGSPAIDQSSSAVGTVVLGSVVIPNIDIMGKLRLNNGKITWGAYDPNAVSTDTTTPLVSITAPANNVTVVGMASVTISASDDVGVTRVELYLDGALQLTGSTAPFSYTLDTTVLANGSHVLSAKAYDATGNHGQSTDVIVTVSNDKTSPTVTAFTMPATSTSLSVPISSLIATDNIGVTGYLITEGSTPPSVGATEWSVSAPSSFSFSGTGNKTVYAWAKDAAGNLSNGLGRSVSITLPDTTAPKVTAFTMPATATSLTVAISTFTATDNVGVTGYLVTESSTVPAASAAGWRVSAPTSFTFSGTGTKTAYAWVKDAAGNVSASLSRTVVIYRKKRG